MNDDMTLLGGDAGGTLGGYIAPPVMDPETRRRLMLEVGLPTMGAQMGAALLAAAQGGQHPSQRAHWIGQAGMAPAAGMQAAQGAERSWREDARAGQMLAMQRLQMQQALRRQQREDQISRVLMGGGGAAPSGGSAAPAGAVPGGAIQASDDDLDIAARILHAEAANQGPEGLAAAAAVMANRARLTGQPLRAIATAPGQFEPWATRRAEIEGYRPEQYAEARRVLEGIASGQIADPTGGATHFLNPDLQRRLGRPQPAWAPEGQGQRIGAHVFYSRPQDFRSVSARGPQQQAPQPGGDPYRQQMPTQDVLATLTPQQRAMLALNPTAGMQAVVQAQTRLAGEQPRYAPLALPQITSLGVPEQAARQIAGLATRAEQDQAIRAYATREQPRPAEQEDTIRREFQALPPVARYSQSVPLFQSITQTVDRLREARRTGQTDQLAELDMVIGIANLFDPGSVVREGEVANVTRTQGLSGDVQRALGYVTSGQRMPESVFDQVIRSAEDRMLSYRRAVDPYARAYRQTAERRGLNADNIILDLGDPVAENRARREAEAAERPQAPPGGTGPRPPAGATAAEVAGRIRALYPDPATRRRIAIAAGIDPALVE